MHFSEYGRTLKKVFGNYRYLGLFVFVSVVFYLLNVILVNYRDLVTFYREYGLISLLNLFLKSSLGFLSLLELSGAVSVVLISILTGIFFSLLIFKVNQIKNEDKRSFIGAFGVALGVISSGCASCGLGIIGVLGLSAGLAVLPLKGLEISIIAIFILVLSIAYTTRKITYHVCQIQYKSERRTK